LQSLTFTVALPSVLLAGAASTAVKSAAVKAGTVVAPNWLLPTAAATTVAMPAALLPLLKGMEQQRDWETVAPDPSQGFCAAHPDAFAVSDAGGKGLGLFAMQRVPKGTYLFDYTGDLLTQTEYDVRYPDKVSDYTCGLRLPTGQMQFIDGRDMTLGAPARFMNHDGERPNVGRRTFCEEGAAPRVLMYALRDLDVGDELQWNYGKGYWDAREGLIQ